ncbi:serine/threonine-protein kinase [Bradyrhizobium betae]|uniref:Serine/threonine protein kinase n=1 Tax=Bradyrhizobium betae TaxID=244734 RepID=A0A5P6NXY1_9BRAD|nr:serine/threonine-protein kinase [Bradyrhizobium betae]MCS3725777.1 serine/threonine-protein kinase [Bradyrhizobium betae]QFI70967.1 serine/threonine protein kinase [Bradyrhizobium betae]
MPIHLTVGQQIGKYTTSDFLGAGVFGSVYRMRDNLMNREVAVKFVENQNPSAFVAHYEAQILHQCRHDRIVTVNSVDVLQDTQARYYAAIDMEYAANGSAQRLIDTSHISVRQAIKLTIDLLFALGHAHRQGVLHRDVKPANILLAGTRGKLSDFGLAANASASLTASGAGSPVYCAPEVVNDDKTNPRTDIFSAGMTLFQLVNNISSLAALVPSLDTIKLGRVISHIGYAKYVPRRLRYICNKACETDPTDRYESADQMRQALEKLHVEQDWIRSNATTWSATVNSQQHEMTIEHSSQYEMVYRVNGRRRNAHCTLCGSQASASQAQEDWVYKNTF